jgi:hypothetical protein
MEEIAIDGRPMELFREIPGRCSITVKCDCCASRKQLRLDIIVLNKSEIIRIRGNI